MSHRKDASSAVLAVLISSILLTGSTTAGCVSAPASTAGADAPHVVDPADDGGGSLSNPLTGGSHPYEIERAWVTQPDPNVDAFAVVIDVAGLEGHPAGAVYYVEFPDIEPYLAAKARVGGTWEFEYGRISATMPFLGTVREPIGTTTGSIDTEAGNITIAIPSFVTPVRPADGSELSIEGPWVFVGTHHGAPMAVPNDGKPDLPATANFADTTSDGETCRVVLYEEVEDEEDEGTSA